MPGHGLRPVHAVALLAALAMEATATVVCAGAADVPPRRVGGAGTLDLAERVAAQRAIEEVYWRHRIWPVANPGPKPSLDAVMPAAALRAKVEGALAKSRALAHWGTPLTRERLQAELDRMARDTRDPRALREIFDALGGDATLAAEALARPVLADRLVRARHAREQGGSSATEPGSSETGPTVPFESWWRERRATVAGEGGGEIEVAHGAYVLPALGSACTDDTWQPTPQEIPDGRMSGTAVWTGSEMIVWGGGKEWDTGGRYDPATDTWRLTSTGAGVPAGRSDHTAVWTGTEMIVWGGRTSLGAANDGGRYDPASDTWAPVASGANVPSARANHTAVWTGSAVIVWGGWSNAVGDLATGGRYDPVADAWTPTTTTGAPSARAWHTAVWTGDEMIVWGGLQFLTFELGDGSRYDLASDTWTPTSTGLGAPAPRTEHTAVWTGTQMIVWGGHSDSQEFVATGGRYDPASDSWTATSTVAAPAGRAYHSAVWTGDGMIVWGGFTTWEFTGEDSGARYDPAADAWTPTSTGNGSPWARAYHDAVWTGSEMIVWGGCKADSCPAQGARYAPALDQWAPTSVGSTVPLQRWGNVAVWTGAEMIVQGGYDESPLVATSGGRYDPFTDTWTPTSTTGAPTNEGPVAVWTGREMIVWGSHSSTGGRYDPLADTWRATSMGANVPLSGGGFTAVWTGTEMLVWGGSSRNPPFVDLDTGARYDPVADAWTPISTGSGHALARRDHTAVWTGTEMIVWGGTDKDPVTQARRTLNSGARYSPASDTWTSTPTVAGVPSPRDRHTAVWTGTEMVVWGGEVAVGTGQYLNDGARYRPATDTWTPTSGGAGTPAPSSDHSSTWTGAEMLVWVTSGPGGRYDPAVDRWKPASIAGAPRSRAEGSTVWTGTEQIVWGGWREGLTSSGGRYCACPAGLLVYRDADGDGAGDPASSLPHCAGDLPAGFTTASGDCDDGNPAVHPAVPEACDGDDDDCDGLVDEEDACDVAGGEIRVWREDDASVSWGPDLPGTTWNLYLGSLAVLRSTGTYTQLPGSNPLASLTCGIGGTRADDLAVPAPGSASFALVTAVQGGTEGSLGWGTPGQRANAHPCP